MNNSNIVNNLNILLASFPGEKNIEYDYFEWGSGQYSQNVEQFHVLELIVKNVSKDKIYQALGINDAKIIENYNYALSIIKININVNNTDMIKHTIIERNELDIIKYIEKIKKINNCNTFDEIFEVCKLMSMDLWNTVNVVFNSIFYSNSYLNSGEDLKLTTGFRCWLLYNYGYIKNIDSFKNFDT